MHLVVALAAFVLMEAFTYLAHRLVMHGLGWVLHRSHHEWTAGRVEANDTFPVVFGGLTLGAMAIGYQVPLDLLVAGTAGVSAYGCAYAFVHDVYIHGRLGRLPRVALLERLRRAHALHHLFGGEPYGMLLPIVSRRLRERGRDLTWDVADASGFERVTS
jgi:beta-carotene 3-hydroxylase